MKLQFFVKRGFLFILVLSAGFLGILDAFAGNFWGSSGNSPFRALSARSYLASSISAEKLNLFGPTERGDEIARSATSNSCQKWAILLQSADLKTK